MKIVRVQTLCLSRLHHINEQWFTHKYRSVKADCALVIVQTDSGLEGIGEASAYGAPLLIRDALEWLSLELIGQDPTDPSIAPSPHGHFPTTSFPHMTAHDCAAAGLDCALWDLRAKIAGISVRKLINPNAPDRLRLYASSGCRYDWRTRPEQLIEETLGYLAQGYSACKVRLGTHWDWDGVTVERFLGLMRDLAKAVDGRMELAVDGGKRFGYEQALTVARALEKLGFKWFEEPIDMFDVEGYSRLNAAVGIAITGGESFATLEQVYPFLKTKGFDIVQPDVALTGMTEALRIAKMAARFGIGVTPHSWHNAPMLYANAQFLAGIESALPLEHCLVQGPLQEAVISQPLPIQNGFLELPDSPGLGFELAQEVEKRFPYIERHYALEVNR
jgi:L-alanine-DL-glutamate epimerase-like enolase superfamily enzyme